jgi:hypothetical protein
MDQCSAKNRLGEQCRRHPMPGTNVCSMHGGKAPQVLRAAKERLIRGAEHAIDCVLDIIKARPACPTCQRADDPRMQLRASQILLDRAGLGPTSTSEVDDKNARDQAWARWLNDEQLDTIATWILAAKLREEQEKEREAALLASQLEDAAAPEEGTVH